jgi:GT2 family glycosyltransferase/glycosyltransferase involved in cell wall biosynthesis
MKPVTIVILTWNALRYTKRCLETLRANTLHTDYRVLVADNGSSDGTLEYLRGLPWITLISNEVNLGFAKANNRAIQTSLPSSDIVLLNNDTEIHQPDWLSRLQETAYRSEDTGIAGCRLKRPDGTFQHAGTYVPLETWWGQQIGTAEKDINQYNADREVEGVVFACAYIKREVLNRVGLLDEDYFSYFEDTDYCLRARQHGYKVVCCGSVTLVHHENVSTKINSVELGEMFFKSQKVFRSKWEQTLKHQRYTRRIGWHSTLSVPNGYAISSQQLILALDQCGVEVSYKYLYGPGTVFPFDEPEKSDSYMVNMIRSRRLDAQDPQIVYGQGDSFEANFGRYKIGFTMLETDRIPKAWVHQANLMDEVWVPSTFNAGTFRESGVKQPIYVIPLGVDPDHFNPCIADYRTGHVFTFLSIFEWGERKAPEILLRAFNDEFRAGEPVALLCKTLNADSDVNVQAQVGRLNLNSAGGRIIISLNERVPTSQLGALYRSSDCFVLPTRGEGWGMPVIEAMACGLPVIATAWSAHCDFMKEDVAYPLTVEKLVPAEAKCPYYKGARWAQPSYEHLRALMRHVYDNREEARIKGQRASQEVLKNWAWATSAKTIIARLDALSQKLAASSH